MGFGQRGPQVADKGTPDHFPRGSLSVPLVARVGLLLSIVKLPSRNVFCGTWFSAYTSCLYHSMWFDVINKENRCTVIDKKLHTDLREDGPCLGQLTMLASQEKEGFCLGRAGQLEKHSVFGLLEEVPEWSVPHQAVCHPRQVQVSAEPS